MVDMSVLGILRWNSFNNTCVSCGEFTTEGGWCFDVIYQDLFAIQRQLCSRAITKANGMAHFVIVEYVNASEWMNELFQNE